MMTPMMTMNPMSQVANMSSVPIFPPTVNTPYGYNPVMYQTVANPSMLSTMMMPQQHPYQYCYPSVYRNSY